MFNLETSLAAWKRVLEHNPALSEEDVLELVQHLRDQVADLRADGFGEEEAFRRAMELMGDYVTAEREYRKVYWSKRRRYRTLGTELQLRVSMLANYFTVALRQLRKQIGYATINTMGLALGLAVCLVIGLFIRNELAYDRFHDDAARIYRVVLDAREGNGMAWSGPQLGLRLRQDFPQIDAVMRIITGGNGYGTKALVGYQGAPGGQTRRFYEEGFLYTDPDFFNFFSFPLLQGDPATVLSRPGTVVVTESTARKYFGKAEPLGKTLLLSNQHPMEITGVAADPPATSHLTFRFVTSYQTFYANRQTSGEVNSFWWPPSHTYVKLHPDADVEAISAALPAFSARHRDADDAANLALRLQPLTEIWLGPEYDGAQQAGGSLLYVYLFTATALFVLILACVNFMNLATARAAQRAREVGVRKVIGAVRGQLIAQFLSESILLSVAALAMAIGLAVLMLPFFNEVAGKELSMPYANAGLWVMLLGLSVATGLAAGSYPAFYLSAFRPAAVIGSTRGRPKGGTALRKGLVVFQFTVSMVLLSGTAIVYQQLQYVHHTRLDFDGDQILILPGPDSAERDEARLHYEALKEALQQQAVVQRVTAASNRPGLDSHGQWLVWEAEGLPPEPGRQIPVQFVGEGFFQALDLEMAAGRPLRAGDPADLGTEQEGTEHHSTPILNDRAFVVNETAARQLGWTPQEALGRRMRFYLTEGDAIFQDYRGTVVGVVKDYHTTSLREPIGPMVYMAAPQGNPSWLGFILVRLTPGNAQQALRTVERVWQQIYPERPLEASFLDENLDNLYRAEIRFGRLIGVFTILAMLIACLGLFGLASFTAEQRTKEIGIRKVLGASVSSIVALLSKDFLKLVGIAFLAAIPLAYFGMQRWLQIFAYRIEIGPAVFLLTGISCLFIALLTVSYQAVKAALTDPVRSLQYE